MSSIVIAGDTSGSVTLQAPAVAGSSVLSLPAVTDTVAGIAATQTLTNKTLTAPVISSITNTGTLTLPTSTDTLVGRATTDTLTNKTLTSPTLTTPNINSAQFATVSGTAPIYPCRAWVNFNGTGTVAIRASGNVSSITDNGTGDYTVNFTTAMSDANYSAIMTISRPTISADATRIVNIAGNNLPTTTTLRLFTDYAGNTGGNDTPYICVSIFG
jgi:hypothetical protein